MFSFGVFCVMAGVYYLLQDSTGFDRMMHGKSPKKQEKQRSLEDFIVSMQRVLTPILAALTGFRFLLNTRQWHRTKTESCGHLYEWMPTFVFGERFSF
jgi:hypothetical protein